MGFKGTLETERAVAQTVDALLKCPKSREEHLIRKLRSLWLRRLCEIAAVPSARPAGAIVTIANRVEEPSNAEETPAQDV